MAFGRPEGAEGDGVAERIHRGNAVLPLRARRAGAEICERCARSCEQVDRDDEVMRRCAAECRRCAESCRQMAA